MRIVLLEEQFKAYACGTIIGIDEGRAGISSLDVSDSTLRSLLQQIPQPLSNLDGLVVNLLHLARAQHADPEPSS